MPSLAPSQGDRAPQFLYRYYWLFLRNVKMKELQRSVVVVSGHLLEGGGEADPVTGVGHLVHEAHVLSHGLHHVRQRVLLHCNEEGLQLL